MATLGAQPAAIATAAVPRRRHLRGRLVAPVVVVAAVAALGAALAGRGGDAPPIAAPAFSLADVRGGPGQVALEQRGGRPAVVNFFASWCVPCRDELPVLERAHRREGGRVAFLGVAVGDVPSEATGLLRETGVSFPAGSDRDKAVAESYRLRGMPTTVFIGRDGRVQGRAEGPLTAARLDQWLARLERAG